MGDDESQGYRVDESSQAQAATYTVDEALTAVGFGKFQILVLAYAGMGQASEAMEMMLLSFVGPAVQSAWGLSSHQESLLTSVVFAGMLLGAYSWGILSDKHGRKQLVMPSLGWRWLLALSSLPSSLLLVFYGMAPESPRYLCSKGRRNEALYVLEKVARMNRKKLPPGTLVSDHLIELSQKFTASEDAHLLSPRKNEDATPDGVDCSKEKVSSLFLLFAPELVKSTLLLWVVFFGNAFSYYGLVLLTTELNSGHNNCLRAELQSKGPQDVSYRGVFITSFAELPGLLLSAATVDRFGRKLLMSAMFFFCCMFLLPLVFHQQEGVTTGLLFGARICITTTFTVVYIYAPEIYPTSVRTTGVGVASSVGRIGGMICPLVAVVLLHGCHQTASILLFEVVIFLSGVCVLAFPFETRGRELSDSLSNTTKQGT